MELSRRLSQYRSTGLQVYRFKLVQMRANLQDEDLELARRLLLPRHLPQILGAVLANSPDPLAPLDVRAQRQYLSFCTSKASKASTSTPRLPRQYLYFVPVKQVQQVKRAPERRASALGSSAPP